MFKRLVVAMCNILFPPIAVLLLTGPNADTLLNCILFLLAVIPSHIHGFYISLTYFNRKRKVRRGVYPGPRRRLIYSDYVNNGGASRREMLRLKREMETGKLEKGARWREGKEVEDWDGAVVGYGSSGSSRSSMVRNESRSRSRRDQRGSRRWTDGGYQEVVEQVPSRRASQGRTGY